MGRPSSQESSDEVCRKPEGGCCGSRSQNGWLMFVTRPQLLASHAAVAGFVSNFAHCKRRRSELMLKRERGHGRPSADEARPDSQRWEEGQYSVVALYSRTTSAKWCQNYQKGEKASGSMRC
ncbi:hypothetical protein GW17_00035670 [Ensete ventricosum]|nr:hypothetical protein GW17_00035670 [Ensete ventricosum]